VYLLFAGHNQPGGGFVGGLVASSAMALLYLAGGLGELRQTLRLPPWSLLAAGLGFVAATAAWPVITGGEPLDQGAVELHLGPLGPAKVTSATVFDLGVYLIVVGLVLMVFEGLGEDWDEVDEGDVP
jgi:multicomponent Na+:H+ antiporter subunit A